MPVSSASDATLKRRAAIGETVHNSSYTRASTIRPVDARQSDPGEGNFPKIDEVDREVQVSVVQG